jgi:hypothetical protein
MSAERKYTVFENRELRGMFAPRERERKFWVEM